MRIYFDYPLATEENMKAIQDAINSGKTADELDEMFGSVMVWDCIVVLSGKDDTTWEVFDSMKDNFQTDIEDWQRDIIDGFLIEQHV